MKNNIVIVNYGIGNLSSVANMLRKVGSNVIISSKPEDIILADKILLPGVGHFDHGMKMLRKSGLEESLNISVIENKKPILGICLGAQILGKGSEEGNSSGLGWIDMVCRRIPDHPQLRVPHMGWNQINIKKKSVLFSNLDVDSRFYFVHKYYMKCQSIENSMAETSHGIEFTSVVGKENILGTQFHPEKSLKHGLKLLNAFKDI